VDRGQGDRGTNESELGSCPEAVLNLLGCLLLKSLFYVERKTFPYESVHNRV
jgi:hypothetical protein